MKCCPTCKQPLPRDPPVVLGLSPKRSRMYEFLARRPYGATNQEIRDHVYADDPDGGPDCSQIVSVMVWDINKFLEKNGYDVRVRGSGGPGSVYKILGR